jgi:hypothetical protein
MGIILAFIAVILTVIIAPFALIYEIITLVRFSKVSEYFLNIAIGIDQLGNVICQGLFNDILIKKEGFKFGNPDETISSVLGRNYKTNTLTILGGLIRWILDKIEPNHCVKSIEEDEV